MSSKKEHEIQRVRCLTTSLNEPGIFLKQRGKKKPSQKSPLPHFHPSPWYPQKVRPPIIIIIQRIVNINTSNRYYIVYIKLINLPREEEMNQQIKDIIDYSVGKQLLTMRCSKESSR